MAYRVTRAQALEKKRIDMRDRWARMTPEKKAAKRKLQRENHARLSPEQKARRKVNADSWRSRNRDKVKQAERASRLRRYNLTPEEYAAMFEHQGGCCAICRKHQSEFAANLHVDHDHSTRLVRGLLCWTCNHLLPNLKDLPDRLTRAITYLISPPAMRVIGERHTGRAKRKKSQARQSNASRRSDDKQESHNAATI